MKRLALSACLIATLALAGCVSPSNPAPSGAVAGAEAASSPVLQKPFMLEVFKYLYRWNFDQSYVLAAGQTETMEVWARPLHPRLDPGDRSEFAELWIPALNMRVELKRSDYTVPELNLALVDHSFKIKRVTRHSRRPPPARITRWPALPCRKCGITSLTPAPTAWP